MEDEDIKKISNIYFKLKSKDIMHYKKNQNSSKIFNNNLHLNYNQKILKIPAEKLLTEESKVNPFIIDRFEIVKKKKTILNKISNIIKLIERKISNTDNNRNKYLSLLANTSNIKIRKYIKYSATTRKRIYYPNFKRFIFFSFFSGLVLIVVQKYKKSDYFNNCITQTNYLIENILNSSQTEEIFDNFLLRIFSNERTKKAASILITDLMNNNDFINKSNDFGTNLFKSSLNNKEVNNKANELILKIIVNDKFHYEANNLFKKILLDKNIEISASLFLKNIFLRSDIFDATSNLLKEVIIYTISKDETKEVFSNFLAAIWADQYLRWGILKKTFNMTNVSPMRIVAIQPKKDKNTSFLIETVDDLYEGSIIKNIISNEENTQKILRNLVKNEKGKLYKNALIYSIYLNKYIDNLCKRNNYSFIYSYKI